MAGHFLAAGYRMVVFDVRPEATSSLEKDGAKVAQSPAEVMSRCEVVCTSLPGPKEAETVFFGGTGLAPFFSEGKLLIDFSTNAPELIQRTETMAQASGAFLVDAPVSGGIGGARDASLTILAGGSDKTFHKALPFLEKVSKKIIHTGPTGSATICKLMHNCAVLSTNLAMVECMTTAIRAGVSSDTIVEVFQKSGIGRNLDLNVSLPATLFKGNFDPRFALKTAFKDIQLATSFAREVGSPLVLGECCEADMLEAIQRGWGNLDNNAFLRIQEERSGAEIRTHPHRVHEIIEFDNPTQTTD